MPDTTPIRRTGKCPACFAHTTFTFRAVQFFDDEQTKPVCELWNCGKCGSTRSNGSILWSRNYPPVSCPDCGAILDNLTCPRCNWQVYRLHNGYYVHTPAPANPDATLARLDRELVGTPLATETAQVEVFISIP